MVLRLCSGDSGLNFRASIPEAAVKSTATAIKANPQPLIFSKFSTAFENICLIPVKFPNSFQNKKREANPKGESVPRYHLIHSASRASLRFKGRAPHSYSIHYAASEATFTLRHSGQPYSREPSSLWMRKRYSSSSLAILILSDYNTKFSARQCAFLSA